MGLILIYLFIYAFVVSFLMFHEAVNFMVQSALAGGPYAVFAGKECSRALALMSTKVSDANGDLSGLPAEKLQILRDWEAKFLGKYRVVGMTENSEVDLAACQKKNAELLGDVDVVEPSGHKTPLFIGITAVAGAAVMFIASVLPMWAGKGA